MGVSWLFLCLGLWVLFVFVCVSVKLTLYVDDLRVSSVVGTSDDILGDVHETLASVGSLFAVGDGARSQTGLLDASVHDPAISCFAFFSLCYFLFYCCLF